MVEYPQRLCWCGDSRFTRFSDDYLCCVTCGTLVSQVGLSIEQLTVYDDNQDFYGREYWFTHQEQDLGFNNIIVRVRSDLPERGLHWLRTVLKYKLPHGKALELGSAHGGFVALLQQAGFDATGLELSAWVVDFARKTFDVPMLLGPIEDQQIEHGTLDVIALMDVLEHLPDPVDTMRQCLELLKPDGILVIQTPCYPLGTTYEAMLATNAPFLDQLKSNEHLYLYSQASVRKLFQNLKAEHLVFEPAIFVHYDMFFVVSRQPLTINTSQAIEEALSCSVSGRIIQALIDVDDKRIETERKLAMAEADRVVRLNVIESQGQHIGMLEAERNLQQAELIALRQHFANAEADRAERLEVIQSQGQHIGMLEAERNLQQAELIALRQHFANAEADRAVRLEVIQSQDQRIGELEAAHTILQYELAQQTTHVHTRLRTAETLVRQQQKLLEAIQQGRLYRLLRQAGQWQWFETALANISASATAARADAERELDSSSFGQLLTTYRAEIDAFNDVQPNKDLLDRIRHYNHQMVYEFNTICSLKGSLLLDIGASPHGYALESALDHGATLYVGVGLDAHTPSYVVGDSGGAGLILRMDATALQFPNAMFDLVLSISTFEHVSDASLVLDEIARVLKPGGRALISFEPIWTCSYGHHLHHFGECAKVVPPWAHLMWTSEHMRETLRDMWRPDAPLSLEQAIEWVYRSDAINRVDLRQFQALFKDCSLKVEWIVELKEAGLSLSDAKQAAQITGYTVDELMTKGLSVLLVKQSD